MTDDHPLARKGDPVTSHIAAEKLKESGKWRAQKYQILAWMRENEIVAGSDLTASEIAQRSGYRHPVVHKRLPDLEWECWVTKHMKRNCRVTGESAWTWRLLTDKERAEAEVSILPFRKRKGVQREEDAGDECGSESGLA